MGKPPADRKPEAAVEYQVKLATPFAVLGICIEEDWLTGIEYLPIDTPTLAPRTSREGSVRSVASVSG